MAKKNYEYTDEELADIAIANPDFKCPQFAIYVNDVLGSNRVLMLSDLEYRVYLNLLFAEWNEPDCGLPTVVGILVRLSRVSGSVSVENIEHVKQFFFEYKGRLFNRRLLEERIKQIKKREINRNNINKRYEQPTKNPTTVGFLEGKSKGLSDKDNDTDKDNKEVLKDTYKSDPKLLYVRYWRRMAGDQETIEAKKLIEKYGIDRVVYAFHESMEHSAYSLAYVRKILASYEGKLLPAQAKEDAEKLETISKQNHATEQKDSKLLEQKQKEEEKKFHDNVLSRFKSLKPTLKKQKQEEIQKAINEGIWMRAERLIYEAESGEVVEKRLEIKGVKSIEDAIKFVV